MVLAELYSKASADVKSILDATSEMDKPPIIIGGYVRHLVDCLGYNDIDWLCFSEQSFIDTIVLMSKKFICIAISTCKQYQYFVSKEDFDKNVRNNVHQVHTLSGIDNPSKFLLWSDLTVCGVGFNKTTIIKHRMFDHDIKKRILRINETCPYKVSQVRLEKYMKRGYVSTCKSDGSKNGWNSLFSSV